MTYDEPNLNSPEPKLSDPVPRGDEQSSPAKIGIFAVIAVVVIGGLMFLNKGDGATTTATNTAPGVTTGSSPSAPASR
jgi:hypothetical protein